MDNNNNNNNDFVPPIHFISWPPSDDQPFFVINDEGYNRMMERLRGGERYAKSFMGVCPHQDSADCRCKFFINFLDKEGNMVRVVNGEVKPVVPLSVVRGDNVSVMVSG